MRKIIAYKGYYQEFMSSLSDNERKKIMRALLLFETEEKMPHHYIKYIRDGLYEFRVTYGNNEFRLFFTSFPQLFYPLVTRQFFCDFHEKSEDFCVS